MKLNNNKEERLNWNKDKALISKELVTLKHDAPVDRELSEFKLKEIDKDNSMNSLEKWNLIDY